VEESTLNEPPTPQEKLLAKGDLLQVIRFTWDAALQKQIFADHFVPSSSEFEEEDQGVTCVA
jgi:hypothetical protein